MAISQEQLTKEIVETAVAYADKPKRELRDALAWTVRFWAPEMIAELDSDDEALADWAIEQLPEVSIMKLREMIFAEDEQTQTEINEEIWRDHSERV